MYYLQNGMTINGNVQVTGNGVMFFNQLGPIKLNGKSAVNVTAPTSEPYRGVLIFQSRS